MSGGREASGPGRPLTIEQRVRAGALRASVAEVGPLFDSAAFTHAREHNIYFDDGIGGVAHGHPQQQKRTINVLQKPAKYTC